MSHKEEVTDSYRPSDIDRVIQVSTRKHLDFITFLGNKE
jgi:hypothetical protein